MADVRVLWQVLFRFIVNIVLPCDVAAFAVVALQYVPPAAAAAAAARIHTLECCSA